MINIDEEIARLTREREQAIDDVVRAAEHLRETPETNGTAARRASVLTDCVTALMLARGRLGAVLSLRDRGLR